MLKIEVNIVSLLFVGESAAGVDDLSAVYLSVLNVLGSSHNGYVYLTTAGDYVIPVDKVNVSEQTKIELPSLMVRVSLLPKNTERRCPSVFILE